MAIGIKQSFMVLIRGFEVMVGWVAWGWGGVVGVGWGGWVRACIRDVQGCSHDSCPWLPLSLPLLLLFLLLLLLLVNIANEIGKNCGTDSKR